VFIRREDAARFVEEVRSDDPDVTAKLRIEERELEAGGLKRPGTRKAPRWRPSQSHDRSMPMA
jgi:hypothetical protein